MAGYIGSKASVVSSGAERKKVFNITTSTTVLTGLSYTANQVHVFHNGVRLISGTDYTETNDTTITLTNAAENGDQVVVVSYASFQTSDTVSASAGGTFSNDVTVNGDLTVDTDTLHVDSANNRVGIGTSSPSKTLDVEGQLRIRNGGATGYALLEHGASATATNNWHVGSEGDGTYRFYNGNFGSGSEKMRIDASGRVTMPFQPAFNATATSSTILGSAWQTVDYAQSVSQRGSSYNSSNYRFTAPISGWYQFNASWSAEDNADSDGTFVFAINGNANANKGTVSMPNTSSGFDGHIISACMYLAANDYVEVQRYSTVQTQTRGYSWTGNFSGFLIG